MLLCRRVKPLPVGMKTALHVSVYIFIYSACSRLLGFVSSLQAHVCACVCVCVLTLSAVWRKHSWWLMISEGGRLLQSCDTVWKQQRHGLEKWPDHRSIRKNGKQKGRVAAVQITRFLIVVRLVNVTWLRGSTGVFKMFGCYLFIYPFIYPFI